MGSILLNWLNKLPRSLINSFEDIFWKKWAESLTPQAQGDSPSNMDEYSFSVTNLVHSFQFKLNITQIYQTKRKSAAAAYLKIKYP